MFVGCFISHSSDSQFSMIDGVKVSVGGSKDVYSCRVKMKIMDHEIGEKHGLVGTDTDFLCEHQYSSHIAA